MGDEYDDGWDDWERWDDERAEREEERWTCAYPGECLAPDPYHMRDECHTAEDMENYYAELAK